MPRLGGAYCFRRVRSHRKSVDWGTLGPALGGATSAKHTFLVLKCFVSVPGNVRLIFELIRSAGDPHPDI